MPSIAILLLSLGVLGLLLATFLAPLIVRVVSAAGPGNMIPSPKDPSLEILVAAHNEEDTILATLESLVAAAKNNGPAETRIIVGLDHCSDQTEALVASFAAGQSVSIGTQPKRGAVGKWQMVAELVQAARADWVALVDSGSVWEPDLLELAIPWMRSPQTLAIAPSYMPIGAGTLERLQWRVEQWAKESESRSGGPISVHGATVLYRRTTLMDALKHLEGRVWLNDDLVIPSVIRLSNRENRIVYLRPAGGRGALVMDRGLRPDPSTEVRRRRRIAHGSVEWLILMVSLRFWRSPVVAMLVVRRVSRMLWPYWFSCLAAAAAVTAISTLGSAGWLAVAMAAALLIAGAARINYVRRLGAAYLSGLKTPYYFWRQRRSATLRPSGVSWQ